MLFTHVLIILSCLIHIASAAEGVLDSAKIWCVGTGCKNYALSTNTTAGVFLGGGGEDTKEAFEWQIKNANKGDFVVIRTSGDDAYNQWIYDISVAMGFKLNSVTTILFRNKACSSDPAALAILQNAEAIFLAGGDQSEYLEFWSGTQVQSIIQEKSKVVTIGGTSAGCMVQGHWVYTGENGSTVSDEAMADPYGKMVTISPAFLKLPYLDTFITDTHFVTRDRMGRMLTFLARNVQDNNLSIARSVGIDEHTALLLSTDGSVVAVGVGTAYVCSSMVKPEVCKSGQPLTYTEISCTRLDPKNKDSYSFVNFKGTGVEYTNSIVKAKFTTLPYGPK